MKIEFKNLGRTKAKFTVEVKEINYVELYKVVRKYLFNREVNEVNFLYSKKLKKGKVVVGITFRPVGEFEVLEA